MDVLHKQKLILAFTRDFFAALTNLLCLMLPTLKKSDRVNEGLLERTGFSQLNK